MIGTARALAAFVTEMRAPVNSSASSVGSGPGQSWADVLFHTVSFVGAEVFAAELLAAGSSLSNIVVTQTMPPPRSLAQLQADSVAFNDPSLLSPFSLLFQFASAMDSYSPGAAVTFGSLEGYVAGSVVVDILTRLGPMTPASLTSYIEAGAFFDGALAGPTVNQSAALAHLQTMPSSSLLALNDSLVAPWARDQFLSTAYSTGVFIQGGLELGPLQAVASCSTTVTVAASPSASASGPTTSLYRDSCLVSTDATPCNQLAFSVYMSRLELQSATATATGLAPFVYREIVPARSSWKTCNENSAYIAASARPFVFGQTAVFSGIAADLGTQVRRGIRAAFRAANLSPTGGVRQRQLLLVSYDDGYTESATHTCTSTSKPAAERKHRAATS